MFTWTRAICILRNMKTNGTFQFPEPLFESWLIENKVCLVCGTTKASSCLRTTSKFIIPICNFCSSEWNFHGYYILRRIKPKKLFWNIFKYKLSCLRPSWFSVIKDISNLLNWSKKMKRYL